MTEPRPLKERLKPQVPLRFPNFEKHFEISTANAYTFDATDCRDWYYEMLAQILEAVESNRYLPIYRMGDGEYRFALGESFGRESSPWRLSLRQLVREFVTGLKGKKGYHKSGSGEYGFEEYSPSEREQVYSVFTECLRYVSKHGILALGLHDRPIYQTFIPEIFDWFDSYQILINRKNYYHVYAIYALMHGPDRFALLKGRRILVITSLTPVKQRGIEAGLRKIDVADVQFLEVSSSKAMFDKINLEAVEQPVDVVLIGAGVGSVNILAQLEPLQTACLDVGFALSTLANPDLRWNRPFCIPDDEFDMSKVRWLR